MIDFKNTTYFVRRTEKDEVIKILKKHSEYKGFDDKYVFKNVSLVVAFLVVEHPEVGNEILIR